jgi:hypothetical protein
MGERVLEELLRPLAAFGRRCRRQSVGSRSILFS